MDGDTDFGGWQIDLKSTAIERGWSKRARDKVATDMYRILANRAVKSMEVYEPASGLYGQ